MGLAGGGKSVIIFLSVDWFLLSKMATSLRMEDRLDGAGNCVPWKARIVLILEENELWDEVVHSTLENPIQAHSSDDAQALATFNKKTSKPGGSSLMQ